MTRKEGVRLRSVGSGAMIGNLGFSYESPVGTSEPCFYLPVYPERHFILLSCLVSKSMASRYKNSFYMHTERVLSQPNNPDTFPSCRHQKLLLSSALYLKVSATRRGSNRLRRFAMWRDHHTRIVVLNTSIFRRPTVSSSLKSQMPRSKLRYGPST
jgi:hypothetical protein